MREGELELIDTRILMLFRNPADPADPLGPPWVEEAMRDLTALGSMIVLTIITLAAAIHLALAGKRHAALFLVVAVGGGVLLSFGAKAGFERARPDLVAHGARVFTTSFPSGHSMMAAVAYLTMGTLLARVQPQRRLKIWLIGLAVLISRRGRHQPGLSRRALAERRAGGLGARGELGDAVLGGRAVAAAARPDRARGRGGGSAPAP